MTDDFIRQVSAEPSMNQSQVATRSSIGASSMAKRQSFQLSQAKKDPYQLDFTQLRNQYVESSTIKIPFVKSSFVHYSKCPRNMTINEKEYKDLVLTMELIQAPQKLNYTTLEDPKKARAAEIERRKQEKIDAAIAEKKKAKEIAKAEILAVKEKAKQERLQSKADRAAEKLARKEAKERARNERIQSGSGTEDDDEDSEEEEDDESEADETDEDEEDQEEDDDEDFDIGELDLSSYGEEVSEEESSEDSGSGSDSYGSMSGEDREYTGDMFKKTKGVKFAGAPFKQLGVDNDKLGTNDYTCISIWSSGGQHMRYTRLKDSTLRIPPLETDCKFRVGHDAKRLYYIGKLDGKCKLVVIWLHDLSHEFLDLGPDAQNIETLEDSSLFKDYLCYATKERVEIKQKSRIFYRDIKNFHVINIRTQKKVWTLPDCEKVFFRGSNASEKNMIEFVDRKVKLRGKDDTTYEEEGDDYINLEEESVQKVRDYSEDENEMKFNDLHRGIMVVKSEFKEEDIKKDKDDEDKKDDAGAADGAAEDGEKQSKTQWVRYFRAYLPQWLKDHDEKRLVYEQKIDVKMAAVLTDDAATKKLSLEDDDEINLEVAVKKGKKAEQLEENQYLITSDNTCRIMCMIIKGIQGDQHKVFMFNTEKRDTINASSRAGNTDLEFNMNSHIRDKTMIFVCQTESNGSATAKQLSFDAEDAVDKMPPINFTKPARGYVKDCWLMEDEEFELPFVMTICRSSTDEYINADCLMSSIVVKDEIMSFKCVQNSTKVKAQEIDLNYPCLVANIGLSRLMIQSLTNPDMVSTFKMDEMNMEFICFAEYRSEQDIGFLDKRDPAQAEIVPFSETGDKIAFLTRRFKVCEDECDKGDMLLNVLSIDSYSQPMKFELYTTDYEACMNEGMSDDSIQKCVATQVTSVRGLDVAFVAQYNDRIIFDCITSTKQPPIRFPLFEAKEAKKQKNDPDFQKQEGEIEFEQLKECFGVQMVRQSMVLDEEGAIYFMMKTPNDTVKVIRADPKVEMGGDGFCKEVFTLRSSKIYFMLQYQGQFYIMDDQKKIRLCEQNKESGMFKQLNTLELPQKDANSIVYADFDEYAISDGVLHCNDRMYFLLNSKSKDNATWASEEIMIDNHLHVSGPRYAKESGLIWYMQSYATNLQEESSGGDDEDFFDIAGSVPFRGYSVIMQPLADESYIDLLPQRGSNNNNFVSFINDKNIMMNFSGRYLIFNLKGQFSGQVTFTNTKEGFRGDQIKLVEVSDSGKFFVFEGPKFLTKEEKEAKKKKKKARKENKKQDKKDKKAAGGLGMASIMSRVQDAKKKDDKEKGKDSKNQSGGKKAPVFYVFKLENKTNIQGKVKWTFQPHQNELFPFIEPPIKAATTQVIDHNGKMSQCTIKSGRTTGDVRELEIIVKNYKSKDPNVAEEGPRGGFFGFGNMLAENPESEERYRIEFDSSARNDKKVVLAGKIAAEQKRVNLGHGSKDALERLQRRDKQIERAWVFDNFIIIKSGSELKYVQRQQSVLGMYNTSSLNFDVAPGAEVWIENIFATGIEDLIQLFIIDDANRRLFIVTWNLQSNREHSLFQSTYLPDVFPENLIMKGKSLLKQQDFNYFLDNGAIINLENNLPIQFFDVENEADTMPKGPLSQQVEGMKRVSSDRLRYLDMTKPGRVHHFISFADLLYWERFQLLKEKHEVSKGILSTFSPIARFPAGISVFHYFATNVKVLNAVQDAMQIALQERTEDVRVNMLPLVFLHSNPALNKPGKKTTPIHIALDKQSPIAFETMFQLLVDQKKVCVTQQLLDVLDPIINSQSQAVLDFFDKSFIITDQYEGLRALEWEEAGDEKITAISSCYITDQFMQSLVKKTTSAEQDEEEESKDPLKELLAEEAGDAPFKYSGAVEPQTHVADDSNLKQVEAKVLDFNWVFIGDNSARLTDILANTDNDEIFAQAQIRVFVDFMWQGYFDAIFNQLFIPFIFYFVAFIAYTGYFAKNESAELSIPFVMEIICIVVFGKTFVTFLILEIIQIKSNGLSYFFDVWNVVDVGSLSLNALYVYGETTNGIHPDQLSVIASICLLLMWFKLFYWMRLFKPFSAFIRMITEIIKDVKVFLVMLLISLSAFANIIFVLNQNRIHDDTPVIFDSLIGIPPLDAMIHAYLTGLGDFNKDNYSEDNSRVVWIMFILATIIVQLIFMNLLIAIMGESFSRITAIMQQSTLKELCCIMQDHIWLQKIDELFENKRYILWLTPDTSTSGNTIVERQIQQLKDQVKSNSEAQEQRILRAIGLLSEDVASIKAQISEMDEDHQKNSDDEY